MIDYMAAAAELTDDELAQLLEEYAGERVAFSRCETRRTRLKRPLDCGHVIDGSEPYRYQVWKLAAGELEQRLDCEFCARRDLEVWR